jgi:cytoskeletal protein RodZ
MPVTHHPDDRSDQPAPTHWFEIPAVVVAAGLAGLVAVGLLVFAVMQTSRHANAPIVTDLPTTSTTRSTTRTSTTTTTTTTTSSLTSTTTETTSVEPTTTETSTEETTTETTGTTTMSVPYPTSTTAPIAGAV